MDETQIITAIITGVFGLITTIVAILLKNVLDSINSKPKVPDPVESKPKVPDPKYSKKKKRERLLRKTLFVLIVIVIVLSSLLAWSFHSPVPSETFVRITYPLDNAQVNLNETIHGLSQNIPQGQVIWVVVYLDGYRYYPAETSAAVLSNGDWSSFVWIGEVKDVGRQFDIIAVLANQNVQSTFNAYVTESRNTGVWLGLADLPEGAINQDTPFIHVIRK